MKKKVQIQEKHFDSDEEFDKGQIKLVPKVFRARLTKRQKAGIIGTKATLADVCDYILSKGNQSVADWEHHLKTVRKWTASERWVKGAKVILVQEKGEDGKMKSYFVEKA